MWVARTARPGAIYDASAAAQTFSVGEMVDILEEKEDSSENEEKEDPHKGSKNDFGHMHGLSEILQGKQSDVNKVNILKKNKKPDLSKTHFTVSNLLFPEKAIRELKGEVKYQIKPPSVGRREEEFAIEIHCDAGKILTKAGNRSQRGIRVFSKTNPRENQKC